MEFISLHHDSFIVFLLILLSSLLWKNMTDIHKQISYPRSDNPLSPPVGDKVELQFHLPQVFVGAAEARCRSHAIKGEAEEEHVRAQP